MSDKANHCRGIVDSGNYLNGFKVKFTKRLLKKCGFKFLNKTIFLIKKIQC